MRDDSLFRKDAGKPPMQLLPHLPLVEISKVLDFGAKKYSPHGWRDNAGEWSRIIGCAERHLGAFKDGETVDPETGISHIAHAACNLLFLLEFELRGLGLDDRWNLSQVHPYTPPDPPAK